MSSMTAKKVCIFDFGNVLIRFEPAHMTSVVVNNAADAALIAPVVFDRLYWAPLDDGTMTDDQVIAAIRTRLPARLHTAAEQVYRTWYRHLPEIEGMRALLAELKEKGRELYLLSNISIGFAEGYADVPALASLLALFDGLVFSGPLHLVKPDAAIFRHLLETYHLHAEDCVFIDDSPINVQGARAVGIDAVLFNGDAQSLRATLIAN